MEILFLSWVDFSPHNLLLFSLLFSFPSNYDFHFLLTMVAAVSFTSICSLFGLSLQKCAPMFSHPLKKALAEPGEVGREVELQLKRANRKRCQDLRNSYFLCPPRADHSLNIVYYNIHFYISLFTCDSHLEGCSLQTSCYLGKECARLALQPLQIYVAVGNLPRVSRIHQSVKVQSYSSQWEEAFPIRHPPEIQCIGN